MWPSTAGNGATQSVSAVLTRRRLEYGVFSSTEELEDAIGRYIDDNNIDPKPVVRTKSADEILASVARFCQRTSSSHR